MPALIGGAAVLAAAAIAIYGAYGDPHPKASQESAVPFLVIVDLVVTALLFGLMVPRALRSGAAPWGLVSSIVALVLVFPAFWSGAPLAIGAAGALIGAQGRQRARDNGARAGGHTAALVIGVVAMAACVVMTVLGNTVISSS
jgi:hypothetical protein